MRTLLIVATIAIVLTPGAARAQSAFPPWMANGLVRSLDAKERAYFGQPLLDVVAAMNKAAQANHQAACTVEVTTPDGAPPTAADVVQEEGRLTPAGIEPLTWDVPVMCSGFEAVVSLSAAPADAAPQKRTDALSDVTVSGRRLVISEAAGPAPSEAEEAASPELVRPHTIEIRFDRKVPNPQSAIDADAARAALNAVKPSRTRPSPAVEVDRLKGDATERANAEKSVIAYLLGREGHREKTFVVGTTWRGGLPVEAEAMLPQFAPEILSSAIADYRSRNMESQAIAEDLAIPNSSVTLVPEERLRSYFEDGNLAAGWARFREAYGDDRLFTFSRVGFSHDLSQAVVFMGYQGTRVGIGSLYFLARQANGWHLLYQLRLNVS
jgi:hypothetical protein